MTVFGKNVFRAAIIALGLAAGTAAQSATLLSTTDIEIGNPAMTFGTALFDIGLAGSDFTTGYEFVLRIPDELELVQIATSGTSSISVSSGPAGTADPAPGAPPTGLTFIGTATNSAVFPGTNTPEVIYASIFAGAFSIDLLQLSFISSAPGDHVVTPTGFSEGFYTPNSLDITRTFFDEDFTIKVTDPNVIPLPAGLPLLLSGLGIFAVVRRRGMG